MNKFFPWRIFRKVYFFYFVLQSLLGLGVAVILWGDSVWRIHEWPNLTLSAESVVIFAMLNFFGALLIGLWMVLSFLLPLKQALLKARGIANKKFRRSLDVLNLEDIKIEELGEFSELEHQLNQIYRKLRSKNDKIAREKEELKTLMGSISNSILAVDVRRNLLFYNERFRTRFLDQDFEKGKAHLREMSPNEAIVKGFESTLAEGEASHVDVEVALVTGESREFRVSIAPLFQRKDGGQVYGAIAVFHDLTAVKKVQQIRSDFVANASHELRTPMTSLKGYVATLREDLSEGRYEDAESFVNVIGKNVDRLVDLTNDLLTISRLENGASTVHREWVDPKEVCCEIEKDTVELLQNKKHQLVFHIEGIDRLFVDPMKLHQVLFNLVTNAIKYMNESGEIHVTWRRAGDDAVLCVRDNGPGIAPEHLKRIFERFYRIDKGRARTDGGTGLGLAIVKHIMVSHEGSVDVESELGSGTIFQCRFPNSLSTDETRPLEL